MSKEKERKKLLALEERLLYADPAESGKLTKKLVRLKEKWLNG